ncbi:DUF3502 domain-containing protein [Faecalimonas sp.]
MKKALVGILIVSLICCTGCSIRKQTTDKQEKVTKLVWQSEQRFWEHQNYFNQVLKEKGYPYEVEFVTSETVQKDQIVDLLETGMPTWAETYDTDKDAVEGRLLPLDDYLKTKEGKQIKDAVPEKIWDSYKIKGKQYTVVSPGIFPNRTVYIWDTTLAKKYNVHPENWDGDLWKYKEELLKVAKGEKKEGRKNFAVVSDLLSYAEEMPETTKAMGIMYPIIFRENKNKVKAEFSYETPEYKRNLAGMREFYKMGLWRPELDGERETEYFLSVETQFRTKNAYLGFREPNFWATHELKEFHMDKLWELSPSYIETGITTKSNHPEEAFGLLCALYTDKDLVNAIEWGEKGVNYDVIEGKAVKPMSQGEYIPHCVAGNQLLGYVEVNQDNNLKKIYPQMIDKAKVSKASGFRFSGKGIEKELEEIVALDSLVYSGNGDEVIKNMEQIIDKYKQSGIDKVIAEWNRQFEEWEKNKK